ncbi:hypothetical protein GS485_11305 [Rhodococcus hoagii]|nr:hypothetical protein [Prescottella equi]
MQAFTEGVEAVRALDRRDLFLWLGKIYYGLLYAESLRPMDPRVQDGQRVVSADHLREHAFHHFLLQSARGAVRWEPSDPGPASFLIYECQAASDIELNFDYMDDLHLPIVALRAGTVGVISVLQDCGDMETIRERRLMAAQSLRLHPTQFRELFAMVRYLARETWQNQAHAVIQGQGDTPSTVLLTPRTGGAENGRVDTRVYAASLADALHTSVEAVYNGSEVACYTVSESEEPIHIPWPETIVTGIDGRPVWPDRADRLSTQSDH